MASFGGSANCQFSIINYQFMHMMHVVFQQTRYQEALQKPWNMKDVFKVFVNWGAYHVYTYRIMSVMMVYRTAIKINSRNNLRLIHGSFTILI